jgi:hypothetical protein
LILQLKFASADLVTLCAAADQGNIGVQAKYKRRPTITSMGYAAFGCFGMEIERWPSREPACRR